MNFNNWDWIGDMIETRANLTPEREGLYDLESDKGYSYQEINFRANKLANYFKDKLSLEKKDRVAFLSRNRIEMFDAFFATGKTGTIFVPYNVRLSVEELEKLSKKESPEVLFYEDIFADKVEKIKKKVNIENYILLPNEKGLLDDPLYEITQKESKSFDYEINKELEDIHLIMHTGGTTGLPKGAKISHRAILFNSLNEIISWNINHKDSTHLLLPLFHTGGWNLLTIPLLQTGGRVLINREFDPDLTLNTIEKEKITLVFGAATIFRVIAQHNRFNEIDFSSVRWMMSGAAPTPKEVMEKYWNKGIKFCAGYGLTEGGPNNLSVLADHCDMDTLKEKYNSVGIPFYFTEAKIVDENGDKVKQGEEGELIFSGPQIFSGYWNNEEETEQTLKNGWVYTGDMAKKDEDGYYYIVGRKKNMFISGGENVFPPEIENILYEIEEVNETCVISVPDKKWGEVGKAVISLKDGKELTKKDIIEYLEGKLAKYKVPKYVTFVDEVPKNSVGKIVSSKVEEIYGEAKDDS